MGAYSYGHDRWRAYQYGPRKDYTKRADTGKELINVGKLAIVRQAGKAWVVDIEGRWQYLPQSQVTVLENGTATMPRWLAKKYNLKEVTDEAV
jgi:hypothetical protein